MNEQRKTGVAYHWWNETCFRGPGNGRAARLPGTEKRDSKEEKRLLSYPGSAGRGDVLG